MNTEKITGGIIVAAGKNRKGNIADPLLQIGSITIIKRIVLTFQQAEVSPIVVITGYDAEETEYHLNDYGVIFIRNEHYEDSQMLDSARLGLKYLKNKCDQIIFTPVDIPMFTKETIKRLIRSGEKVISPSYKGRSGHPLSIASELVEELIHYNGNDGMRGAIKALDVERKWMEVEDEGILHDMDELERLEPLIAKHNEHILHPFVRISIEKEKMFFNSRTKLLLVLIQETHSVRSACKHMALSYSKAWNMLNELEMELGYEVVQRKHGGSNGGKTSLTEKGERFLRDYMQFEDSIRRFTVKEFSRIFLDGDN